MHLIIFQQRNTFAPVWRTVHRRTSCPWPQGSRKHNERALGFLIQPRDLPSARKKYLCFKATGACVHARRAHDSDLLRRGNRTGCRNMADYEECKHTWALSRSSSVKTVLSTVSPQHAVVEFNLNIEHERKMGSESLQWLWHLWPMVLMEL